MYGREIGMHTIWYMFTTIMSGGPGDILIVKAIIVVSNPRGLHDIVNIQFGQPKESGASRVMR